MSPLSTLYFTDHAVRVVVDPDGVPWFNANDVCAALELANPRDALAKHVDSDDVAKRDVIDSLSRVQLASFINESGLYALTLGSTKEAAKRFRRWVTSEVLPELRRSGTYTMSGTRLPVQPPYVLADLAQTLWTLGQNLGEVPGVSSRTAMAAALQSLQDTTGVSTAAMRAVLWEEPNFSPPRRH